MDSNHTQGHILQQTQIPSENDHNNLECSQPFKCDEWYSNLEIIEVKEQVEWLVNDSTYEFNQEDISNWMKIGSKIVTVNDENMYCDPKLLKNVLKAKEIFDELNPIKLCKARSRANPFETIKSAFFMNRAALKMANIDAATDFMFSNIDRQKEHKQSKMPYYFADICAGPGGFAEYIFWRKRWTFKGFGMTLKGDHDFKLNDSLCAPSETFEALYGILDNGDVYYPENIQDFCSKVKNQSGGLGIHFVMADGGFSVEGQENLQEVLSKQIYVCQCLISLLSLRKDGHFVVKLFDLFTPFSVGLIFLMYHCYHKVGILKPNSSRPANSERYFICSRLKNDDQTKIVSKYMEHIVKKMFELRNSQTSMDTDINEIVPENIIKLNKKFCNYIIESNNRIAQRQIIGLMKLATFCQNPLLIETRQEQLRTECLEYWRIPDKPRLPLPYITAQSLILSSTKDLAFLFSSAEEVKDVFKLNDILNEMHNWHCTYVCTGRKINLCNIYVGLGRNRVYRFQKNEWIRIKGIELIRGSILFAELVRESQLDDLSSSFYKSLHVIDALRLGDTSLADLPFKERLELISIYCQTVNKESHTNLHKVRCRKVLPISKFAEMNLPVLNQNKEWIHSLCDPNNLHKTNKYVSNSLLFFKTDSNHSFNSTIISRVIMHLPNALNYDKSEELYYNFISTVIKPVNLK